jgi:hypothetical protein
VLTLLASLQNVDVIMARHGLDENAARGLRGVHGGRQGARVVAIGLGMWVLPEAARHAAGGLDARTVLLRALAIIGALAVCALTVFAAVPGLLLRTAFGPTTSPAPPCCSPSGRVRAAAPPPISPSSSCWASRGARSPSSRRQSRWPSRCLLLQADSLHDFAVVVLGVQAAGAAVLLGFRLARRPLAAARRREPAGRWERWDEPRPRGGARAVRRRPPRSGSPRDCARAREESRAIALVRADAGPGALARSASLLRSAAAHSPSTRPELRLAQLLAFEGRPAAPARCSRRSSAGSRRTPTRGGCWRS